MAELQTRYLNHPSRYQPSSMNPDYPASLGYPPDDYSRPSRYPPQQVNYLQVQQRSRRSRKHQLCPRYNATGAIVTGILQLITGLLLMSCGSVLIKRKTRFRISWSVWGSLAFYIITGVIGIISKNRRRRLIIAYMAMCGLSAGCACAQAIYDTTSGVKSKTEDMAFFYCSYHEYYQNYTCYRQRVLVILHLFCAAAGFAEMIFAILGLLVGWTAICGPGSVPTETVATQTRITCAESGSSKMSTLERNSTLDRHSTLDRQSTLDRHSTLDRMRGFDDSPSSSLNYPDFGQPRQPQGHMHAQRLTGHMHAQPSLHNSKHYQSQTYEEPFTSQFNR